MLEQAIAAAGSGHPRHVDAGDRPLRESLLLGGQEEGTGDLAMGRAPERE